MSSAYITGISCISPQDTFGKAEPDGHGVAPKASFHEAVLPDFKTCIPVARLRRMNRFTRIGIATAREALQQAGCSQPDAVITATGLGCLEDTEKFLRVIEEGEESVLSPTSFITSTHNTLAGQLALLLQSDAYNYTYAHRGTAFESALTDGLLHIKEAPDRKVVVTAVDELTPALQTILQRIGRVKQQSRTDVYASGTTGIIPGEGGVSLVLEATAENAMAGIMDVMTCAAMTPEVVRSFIQRNHLEVSAIDCLLTGMNGDATEDSYYRDLHGQLFSTQPLCAYKHLCGEYPTANAFGTWLAVCMIRNNRVYPGTLLEGDVPGQIHTVLLINHYKHQRYSLTLLRHV